MIFFFLTVRVLFMSCQCHIVQIPREWDQFQTHGFADLSVKERVFPLYTCVTCAFHKGSECSRRLSSFLMNGQAYYVCFLQPCYFLVYSIRFTCVLIRTAFGLLARRVRW